MKPPEYLGPYKVGETLGKGGMGTVYRARHAKSGDDVAIKLIAPHVSDEMRFRRRFDAEIETLKRLNHRNIVRLIGYGEEQGMLFYSMEFVAGETLQSMIRREKKLAWTTTLDVAIQVCAALKHAHDIGVIHRDLKPANLIIEGDGTVKLVDFGISKIFGHSQTAAGSIMGTADYMSPEQASESGVTARTDLFSLGCVIYAMLCGRPPFRGKNITEVLTALRQRDPVPLDLIDPDLPEDIVQVVNELLEKDPADRPPTALAVMNRLKAMRAGLQRRQTLLDQPPQTGANDAAFAGQPDNAEGDGSTGDTLAGPSLRPGDKTVLADEKTRSDETVAQGPGGGEQRTLAEPSATVQTVSPRGQQATVRGTAASGSSNETSLPESTSDTSVGLAGKTHFQTVSDGDVRESIFNPPATKTEHPALRITSIILLALALLAGAAFLVQSLRRPDAEQLIADIEQHDDPISREAQNAIDRFLRMFPDHPRAADYRDRKTAYQVEAAIRRLRLKNKLRTSESPLYEQAFLQAMDLRQSDPAAAREQLNRWVDVFEDSEMAGDEEPKRLAELARFEASRLDSSQGDAAAVSKDPKVSELMQRIDRAAALPDAEREKLLRGVITLYEDQAWADEAVARARTLLETPGEPVSAAVEEPVPAPPRESKAGTE